jgi:Sulfotransferase family
LVVVPLTFVVGTSRCGSTMLSRLLGAHPDVLSISEFWNCFLETEGSIPVHDMTGEEFWGRLTKVAPSYDGLVSAGIKKDEELKPFPSRFNYDSGMPAFCRILYWLTGEEPDPIYDALAPEVSAWPLQSIAEHCSALFAALAARLGRRFVVERTGGSIFHIEFLCEKFPDANFVFLYRDGPDTALSMSRYPTLRLAALKELATAVTSTSASELETWAAEIGSSSSPELEKWAAGLKSASPEDFEGLISPPYDRQKFLSYPIPLNYFGDIWSGGIRMGTREIRRVRPGGWMPLRYERLLAEPDAELTRLAGFIGAPAPGQWLDAARQFVRPSHAGSAAAQLHPSDLAGLRSVCAAGTRAFDLLESEYQASEHSLAS